MSDAFRRSIVAGLRAGLGFSELVEDVRRFKAGGLTQAEATSVLMGLLRSADETTEDRILELLDLVTGFCHPRHRIW